MKLKDLKKTTTDPQTRDFITNDPKNLAQEGNRVSLLDQGWQSQFLWLGSRFQVQLAASLLSTASGGAQTAQLALPWKYSVTTPGALF